MDTRSTARPDSPSRLRVVALPGSPCLRTCLRIVLAFLCCVPALQAAEPDLRPELEVKGRIDSITVNPSGEIWFGTLVGHVYRSRDWNVTWEEASTPARHSEDYMLDSDQVSQVRFFDSMHGLITGYLGDANDLAYITSDGGKTWKTTTLPSSIWVYDAQTDPGGRAWLVGSTGEVLFSADFGATWSHLDSPYDSVSRSHSVHFVTPLRGIVASLDGGLKLTDNGGRSWKKVKSPSEARIKSCEDDRIETARLLGDFIVADQCGELYYKARSGQSPWQKIRAGDRSIISYELWQDGLIAVAADFEIVQVGSDLKSVHPTGHRLQAFPIDIAIGSGKAIFMDTTNKVSVLDPAGFRSARMLKAGRATTWPIWSVDRDADGTFWGISSYFLYRSPDAGKTWERCTEFPSAMRDLAVMGSGKVMIWDGHGYNARWGLGDASPQIIPDLDSLDIVGLFRRGDLWLAYGGMQYETTRRIEVARTYFSGQFAGSADHGFVAVSTDGGGAWRVVDQWQDGGVQQAFLGDDNTLTLLSWLGAVRRGKLTLEGPDGPRAKMETILPATEQTRDKVPYVERARVLDFIGNPDGWVKGWTHHLGDFLFHTTDGGKTWQKVNLSARAPDAIYRLGGGTWLGYVEPDTLLIHRDGRFQEFKEFEGEVADILVDATGGLLVVLKSRDAWRLPPDLGEWSLLSKTVENPPADSSIPRP